MASEAQLPLHLTSLTLPHLPPNSHKVHIALFSNIANARALRAQLLAGNSEYEYAFIDAENIISQNHILAAVYKAVRGLLDSLSLQQSQYPGLRTRNVHSEIVFSLSPNNNITESFSRFGLTDKTRTLLAIKVQILPDALPLHEPLELPPSTLPIPTLIPHPCTLDAEQVSSFLRRAILDEADAPGSTLTRSLSFTSETLWNTVNLEKVVERYKLNASSSNIPASGVREPGRGRGGILGKNSAPGTGRKAQRRAAATAAALEQEIQSDAKEKTTAGPMIEKRPWNEGGSDLQREVEVAVLGAMVLRVVA